MASGPTIIVVAAEGVPQGKGRRSNVSLERVLRQVELAALPCVVATTPPYVEALRGQGTQAEVVCATGGWTTSALGACVASAVLARPHSPGWLVLPGSSLHVQPETLRRLADDLAAFSLVFPEYKGLRGYPVGFGPEFFSELMALQFHERGTQRLLARYPGHAVEVNDPEVLCHDWEATTAGLLPARHLIDGFHTYQRQ